MLVLIAGPNLTIDRTIRLGELRPGEVLRARDAHASPGGKGVNVARTATALGRVAELVAFLPEGRSGQAVGGWLADDGVTLHAIPIAGEVRSAAIMLEDGGRTTVLNEPGPPASDGAWESYARAVESRIGDHHVLVCSGSVPPESPEDGYARLVRLAAGRGAVTIVDAVGEQLAGAVAAGAQLVCPNLAEAEELLSGRGDHGVDARAADVRRRACAAAGELRARGAQAAAVTAGAAGLALATAEGERWFAAPRARVRNPIGAGDALAAGIACALERGESLGAAVLAGLAAAAASVEQPLPGRLDPVRVDELLRGLATRHPGRLGGV